MNKVVLVTGGFDPLHSGHIEYFKKARELGDHLVVGVNSDAWLTRKKGRPFMSGGERVTIIQNLVMVDHCVLFDDDDNTAKEAIKNVRFMYPEEHIVFANGGDRTSNNIPEMDTDVKNISFEFGVGGEDKKNSSSWILEQWKKPTTERAWGKYKILDDGAGWQVKELAFDVNKALSDQRHFKRSEHWHVVDGVIEMQLEFSDGSTHIETLRRGCSIDIPILTWHKAINIGKETAKVIEVWMGNELTESDIERRD
jgi:cytidyltransferase-like protein